MAKAGAEAMSRSAKAAAPGFVESRCLMRASPLAVQNPGNTLTLTESIGLCHFVTMPQRTRQAPPEWRKRYGLRSLLLCDYLAQTVCAILGGIIRVAGSSRLAPRARRRVLPFPRRFGRAPCSAAWKGGSWIRATAAWGAVRKSIARQAALCRVVCAAYS